MTPLLLPLLQDLSPLFLVYCTRWFIALCWTGSLALCQTVLTSGYFWRCYTDWCQRMCGTAPLDNLTARLTQLFQTIWRKLILIPSKWRDECGDLTAGYLTVSKRAEHSSQHNCAASLPWPRALMPVSLPTAPSSSSSHRVSAVYQLHSLCFSVLFNNFSSPGCFGVRLCPVDAASPVSNSCFHLFLTPFVFIMNTRETDPLCCLRLHLDASPGTPGRTCSEEFNPLLVCFRFRNVGQ